MVRARYGALDKLNLFLNVYGRMFGGILRISWWFPFLILAIFQAAGLAGFNWFYAPGWFDFIFPILSALLPASAFHYPQYYLVLPSIYSAFANFILGPTVWVILSAVAVYWLGGFFSGERRALKGGFGLAFRSYLPLLGAWLIETVLVLVILYIPSMALRSMLVGSPNRTAIFSVILQMVALLVSAFMIYTIPGIMIDRKGLGAAIGSSLKICARNFFLTYFIVFIPSILRIGFNSLLTDLAPGIVNLLNPELIPSILLLQIITGIFINLFIYGSAVFVYKEMAE